ncbi:MAG: NADH-quinone oxidoreductase subunit D [Clostridia bacterium]|nr:NADH-quinone oxidoreductase subunit D [Clostridia bacterium]
MEGRSGLGVKGVAEGDGRGARGTVEARASEAPPAAPRREPEGVHTLEEAAAIAREAEAGVVQELTINLGPQHPSTHGVLRVIARLDGETVLGVQPDIGYLHRNWEKIVEGWMYPQIIPFADRNDYISSIFNEWLVCRAVEEGLGIELTERAEVLRTIFAELNRLISHAFWFGTYAMDIGAFTPFLYALRDREWAYDLFEKATGARQLYSYFRIGGLRNDVPDGWLRELADYLDYFEREAYPEYIRLLYTNEIFIARSEGVGVIPKEVALHFGATGPMLRASGVPYDVRRAEPYGAYPRCEFEIPVGERGDNLDRATVRVKEMRESVRIIRQCLSMLPEGEVLAPKTPRVLKVPEGDLYVRVESPRGELGLWLVSTGGLGPYRMKWRAPSFVNLQLLDYMCRGEKVADLIAGLGTIDIILGEVDR